MEPGGFQTGQTKWALKKTTKQAGLPDAAGRHFTSPVHLDLSVACHARSAAVGVTSWLLLLAAVVKEELCHISKEEHLSGLSDCPAAVEKMSATDGKATATMPSKVVKDHKKVGRSFWHLHLGFFSALAHLALVLLFCFNSPQTPGGCCVV